MTTGQDKTLEALKVSIRMEVDGKQYYLSASRECSNDLGKRLLASLASEEDVHRQKFEEIYRAISSKKTWPSTDFRPDGGRRLRTIFARATEELGKEIKAPDTELAAAQTAMAMENKTYDFYTTRAKNAGYEAERDFYESVAAEEREHHLVLLDYYEYLKDPAAWFVKTEHPSLDAG
jgi:rubrerythrin